MDELKPVDWSGVRTQCFDRWDDTKSGVAEIYADATQFTLTSHQHPYIADFSHPSDRRTVAARALYEQSFGFTWKDVAILLAVIESARHAEEHCTSVSEVLEVQGQEEHAREIVARIAAMLPPRDTLGRHDHSAPQSVPSATVGG